MTYKINKEVFIEILKTHKEQMKYFKVKEFIYLDFLGRKYAATKDGKLFNMFYSKNKIKQIAAFKTQNGYWQFRATFDKRVFRISQHRLVAYTNGLLKNIFDLSLHVHHKNGNKSDNRIKNLQVISIKEHAHINSKKRIVNKEELLKKFEEFCNNSTEELKL